MSCRFDYGTCRNPNCTLHGIAAQQQFNQNQLSTPPDVQQLLNEHYRNETGKYRESRKKEPDSLGLDYSLIAPFVIFISIILLLIVVFLFIRDGSLDSILKAHLPSQVQRMSCDEIRRKHVPKGHNGFGIIPIVGCEPRGVYIGSLRPKQGFVLKSWAGSRIYYQGGFHYNVNVFYDGRHHTILDFRKHRAFKIINNSSRTVIVVLSFGGKIGAQNSFVHKYNLEYLVLERACSFYGQPSMQCVMFYR